MAEAVGVGPHAGMGLHQRVEYVRPAGADELLPVADADDLVPQRLVSGQVFQRDRPIVAAGPEPPCRAVGPVQARQVDDPEDRVVTVKQGQQRAVQGHPVPEALGAVDGIDDPGQGVAVVGFGVVGFRQLLADDAVQWKARRQQRTGLLLHRDIDVRHEAPVGLGAMGEARRQRDLDQRPRLPDDAAGLGQHFPQFRRHRRAVHRIPRSLFEVMAVRVTFSLSIVASWPRVSSLPTGGVYTLPCMQGNKATGTEPRDPLCRVSMVRTLTRRVLRSPAPEPRYRHGRPRAMLSAEQSSIPSPGARSPLFENRTG